MGPLGALRLLGCRWLKVAWRTRRSLRGPTSGSTARYCLSDSSRTPDFPLPGAGSDPSSCPCDCVFRADTARTTERTLPDGEMAPAGPFKIPKHLGITLPIRADLRAPEIWPCSRKAIERAVVTMPEATMDKN